MAQIESGGSSPCISPDKGFKVALSDEKDGRYVTPRKQRLPTLDRLSNSSLMVEDQLEVMNNVVFERLIF